MRSVNNSSIPAILLAAGVGSRLAPFTEYLPKCLMPVRGKPLIDIWLCQLRQADIGPILINTHHHVLLIKKHLENISADIELVYENELLNTGGTVLANKNFIGNSPLLLAHADNLSLCNYKDFLRAHFDRPPHCLITMMTFITDAPHSCGIVELDTHGVVQAFHEKTKNPPGKLANGAVYILEPEVIEYLESLGKNTIDFSLEVLPHFIGHIHTYQNTVYHRDIGTKESLLKAQTEAPIMKPCFPNHNKTISIEQLHQDIITFSNNIFTD